MSTHLPSGSIVVAVDGSEHADRAVQWAARQAGLTRSPLVIAIAEERGEDAAALGASAIELARTVAPEVTCTVETSLADPRALLVDLSAHADLLVLGSRGRGTFRSMVLGSVSAAVSRMAVCPVVVCRPHRAGDQGEGVLVAADAAPESQPVLEHAFAHAARNGLPLTAVHCVWDAAVAAAGLREGGTAAVEPEDAEELRSALVAATADIAARYPEVPVTYRVAHGLIDDVLTDRAARWDLIVVGRHPLDSVSRIVLGSIATAVVERARTNVAVVPVGRETEPAR